MNFPQSIALGLLGVGVGALGTLIGAGGAFLLLPVLVLLHPQDSPATLTAISLSVVFANATSGSIAYARMRRIDYRAGLIFAAAGLPGAALGAYLTRFLDHRIFDPLLGTVLVVGAGVIAFRKEPAPRTPAPERARVRIERDGTTHVYAPRLALGALLSVAVGFASSLLGIGGGILHVPLMAYLLGFPIHLATATSHFVLAILSLAAVLVHAREGVLAPELGRILPLAAGAILGAQIGARLSSLLHGRWILRSLAAALAAVGIRLLFR